MRLRYKKTGTECWSNRFNPHGLGEVLTGDDSVYISELDVFVNGEWKDLQQAFKNHDVLPDNLNLYFFEPVSEEDKQRGYVL